MCHHHSQEVVCLWEVESDRGTPQNNELCENLNLFLTLCDPQSKSNTAASDESWLKEKEIIGENTILGDVFMPCIQM